MTEPVLHRHGAFVHAHAAAPGHRHLLHPWPARAADTPPVRRDGLTTPLRNRTYRRLYTAQVVALLGTGVSSVALSLLAYDLAGANAGLVLGAALALKMVAYVALSPVLAAVVERLPRRPALIGLDLARAAVVFAIPWVTEVWQVFVLIFALNACSAGFTPAFQAVIPDLLPEEREYTKALSLSRLAYDLEALASPLLAASLLLLVDFHALFALNGAAFLGSAALVSTTVLPAAAGSAAGAVGARMTAGLRRYLATPRLRGLLALSFVASAAGAMVIVTTVVIVRTDLGYGSASVAIALAAAGAGSIVAALALPRALDHLPDRTLMLAGGATCVAGLAVVPLAATGLAALLVLWTALGVGMSLLQSPAGRLIRRSGPDAELNALFAAQFSLSHACWLVTYLLAGAVATRWSPGAAGVVLAALAVVALLLAIRVWRPSPADAQQRP